MFYISLNLPKFFYFSSILTANLNGKCFCFYFTNGKTEAQRGFLNYSKPESEGLTSAGGELTGQGVRNPAIATLRGRA